MEQTNVLLVTLPAQGHLNPILRLGQCLVSKGLHVTLVTTSTALQNSPFTGDVHLHLEFISDGLPTDYNRGADIDYYMDTLSKFAPVNLLALIRSCKNKFACIISTPFVPWVADVAEEVDIPHAMLWIQPCTVYQIYNRYYNRFDEFPTESNMNMSVKLPGLPVFSVEELPLYVLPTNKSRSLNRLLNKVFHNMHKVKWVLGNSFTELEKDVIASLSDAGCDFWPVGPLVSMKIMGKKEDVGFDLFKPEGESDCIEWLNKQKVYSVVYISFGTIISLSKKEIQSIATSLKSINRPFLWVIRSTRNQGLKELRFLEEVREQGLIVSWSPQTKVLSHPSVGCFLSHCGWNSLLESLVAGVPIIACPQKSDQPTNANLVTDVWRVGVKLKKNVEGGLTAEEVGRCVEEVMSGPRSDEFRKNALELKTAARETLTDSGSSDNNIKMFVNEVISSCLSCSKQK